jgi:hypothetical protein
MCLSTMSLRVNWTPSSASLSSTMLYVGWVAGS